MTPLLGCVGPKYRPVLLSSSGAAPGLPSPCSVCPEPPPGRATSLFSLCAAWCSLKPAQVSGCPAPGPPGETQGPYVASALSSDTPGVPGPHFPTSHPWVPCPQFRSWARPPPPRPGHSWPPSHTRAPRIHRHRLNLQSVCPVLIYLCPWEGRLCTCRGPGPHGPHGPALKQVCEAGPWEETRVGRGHEACP